MPKPALSSAPVEATVNKNYEDGQYLWDDTQDLVLISSEIADADTTIHGFLQYRQLTNPNICVHFDEYRTNEQQDKDIPDSDSEADEEESGARDVDIDYTCPAKPPALRTYYHQPIYVANTFVSAIFLAIIRIAQKNMPFLDLRSALIHLPNVVPTAAMPKLSGDVFTGDIPSPKRPSHVPMNVALLPNFYADGRHAIGYFHMRMRINSGDKHTQTCLFTPCTTAELRYYGLIEHLPEDGKIASVPHVGSRNGNWLHDDVVEDCEWWHMTWLQASYVWETRMGIFRGAEEKGVRV